MRSCQHCLCMRSWLYRRCRICFKIFPIQLADATYFGTMFVAIVLSATFFLKITFGCCELESTVYGSTKPVADYDTERLLKTVPSDGYAKYESTEKTKTPSSWPALLKKVMSSNRKGSYNKVSSEKADDVNDALTFIHKPFTPKSEDVNSVKKNSWLYILRKILSLKSGSANSSSKKAMITDSDAKVSDDNLLLEDFSGDSDNKISSRKAKLKEAKLPTKPAVDIETFELCSETYTGNALTIFDDGNAPSCVFACLNYKIKNSKYYVRPLGRCGRLPLIRPNGLADTVMSCICNDGFLQQYRYRIVQLDGKLYFVYNKDARLYALLGTAAEIANNIEANFPTYLRNYVTHEKGIDFRGQFDFVFKFRWLRQPNDDRSFRKYLSDSLQDQIDEVKIWWYSLPERMMKFGNNVTIKY